MKQIEPVTIWKNGEEKTASMLNAYIINDNLESSCSFYYSLNKGGQGTEEHPIIIGSVLADGNLSMSGDTYLEWDGSNDGAYEYIANKLNLTII